MSIMSFCRFFNFRQVFALFFGSFIIDFEYSLFIVHVIKCHLDDDPHNMRDNHARASSPYLFHSPRDLETAVALCL